jgi:UMF1 family MFS transporter
VVIDGYSKQPRCAIQSEVFEADRPGVHTLTVQNTGQANTLSSGTLLSVALASVLAGARQQNLLLILGLTLALQVIGVLFAVLFGRRLFSGVADRLDTKRTVILALVIDAIIAVWGYFLDSTVEFWFLAWLVAIVQGGSQALSRSLYAAMSPSAKSGEFFGLFGVMEKFSTILGPILFAVAGAFFASSRPAILSLIVFFIIGIGLLNSVDVDEGRRVARQEDAALLEPGPEV